MNILKTISLTAVLLGSAVFASSLRAAGLTDASTRLLRDASLMLLKEGNARFAMGKPQHPHQDAERRTATASQGQEPIATILACSDSRDPVELIFDRGVGDLFVVRVAGNVAGESELATIEYGVGHLNTPLLIVMGHSKCGAVTAVVKEGELHGHLVTLAEKIKPAVAKAKEEATETEEVLPKAIQANVWQTIEDIIKQSSEVRAKLEAGQVTILGAFYDLEQGKVNWLGAHPAQDALLALAAQAETDAALARKLSTSTPPNTKVPNSTRTAPVPVAKTDDNSSGGNGDVGSKSSGGTKHH
jgi:carbonic anhydrase